MRPISIIGGGLSGLSLAGVLQRSGVPTTLYEARKYPQHKVCGEFICGVEEATLQEMGLQHIITGSIHHTEMQWYMKDQFTVESELPITAWGISRFGLDQYLAQKFQEAGGTLVARKQKLEDQAGVVIGCGKGKNTRAKKWIGLKIHLTEFPDEWKSGLQMHLGTAGYIGLCAVAAQRVNLCGLFRVDSTLRGKGSVLIRNYLRKNQLSALADQLTDCVVDEGSFSAVAGFSLGKQNTVGNFQLGDSSYLIPPFTGNGMSMAIESAHLASDALIHYAKGDWNWQQSCQTYNESFRKLYRKRALLAEILHPTLFSSFGRASLSLMAQAELLPIQTLFKHLRTP